VASCDPDQLAVWWGAAPYNVGIACAAACLLVVDLDGRPADGAPCAQPAGEWRSAVLASLAARAGVAELPDTYAVATPAGEHRYFSVGTESPGRCTVGVLGERVDTRAVGGYVVAAGSVRLVEGRRRYYRIISADGMGPVPAPGWLLAALDPPRADGRPSRVVSGSGSVPAGYGRAAVAGETARVRTARTGTRNPDVFTAAVHLGQLAAAGLLDERQISEVLRAAARVHVGVDGFTAAEVDRAIANGLRYGRHRPRPVSPGVTPTPAQPAAER
jgi:hypothetical protein